MNLGAPSAPPPTLHRQRRRGGVVWPLLLIFVGGVFLLENMGYLPPNFWTNLWSLWPLVLVLIGIELLLSHRVPWPGLAALAAVVLIGGAVATNWNWHAGAGAATTTSDQTDLDGASQAAVTLRFGAGQLTVGPITDPRQGELAVMGYSGPSGLQPRAQYTPESGGVGQLTYSMGGRPESPFVGGGSPRADLGLATDVPITSLNVETGATDARLDLSSLRISNLEFSVGVARTWIRLPQSGATTVHISGGASSIMLEIPDGVAARIQHHGGLSTLTVDQTRFPLVSEGLYESPGFDSAPNKVDIQLETGITTIQVS